MTMNTTEVPNRPSPIIRRIILVLLLGPVIVYPISCAARWSLGAYRFREASKPFLELGGYARGTEMGQLEGAAGIAVIRLDGTKANDDDLLRLHHHLASLPELRVLQLDGTQVTDKGLTYLLELHSLEELYLHETSVTVKGVADLQRELPNCTIEYGPYPSGPQ